jgi:peroxiredoxin
MPDEAPPPNGPQLERWTTSRGETLGQLSERSPVLLVFLRHVGCTFCREAMADLAQQRKRIEKAGVHILLVSMSSRERFRKFAALYRMEDIDYITNPDRDLYRAFGLGGGTLWQLFGWEVWKRGIKAGLFDGHGIGIVEGDGWQLPGVFLISKGAIVRSYRHYLASDRPNYFLFCAVPYLSEARGPTDVHPD